MKPGKETFYLLKQVYGDGDICRANGLFDSKLVVNQLKMTFDEKGYQPQLMTLEFRKSRNWCLKTAA